VGGVITDTTNGPTTYFGALLILQTTAKSVKSGHERADRIQSVSPANDENGNARGVRLKIVVSPVRVRVTRHLKRREPAWLPDFLIAGEMTVELVARVHEMVVVSSVRVRVRAKFQNACKPRLS
jgi:hypothetical protein